MFKWLRRKEPKQPVGVSNEDETPMDYYERGPERLPEANQAHGYPPFKNNEELPPASGEPVDHD